MDGRIKYRYDRVRNLGRHRQCPSATTTKSWVFRAPAPRSSSKLPSASSPCSIIRTAIRATASASTNSRNSTRPTTCSRTATSAPPMTASAMPPSSRAAVAARTASAPILPPPSPTFSKTCSAWAAGGAAAAGPRPRARLGSALQHGNQSGGGLRGQDRANPHSDLGHLRGLLGLRRQGRHQAEALRDLRRRRQDQTCPRLLHPRADLSGLPGPRPGDRRSLPVLRRGGPRHPRAHALGQYPGRRRGWHPHPACRRRRGRPARRPAGRPLYFPVAGAARVLPARRRRPALPGADFHGYGGAGRRIRGAGDRRQQGARSRSPAGPRPAAVSA